MRIEEFYRTYTSDCTAGSANQVLTRFSLPETRTGRCYYRLSHGGKRYSLLFSNCIDSTFSDGSISRANDIGGTWNILSMRVGLCRASGEEPHIWHTCLFDGQLEKTVSGAAVFCCDPIPLSASAGDVLCYEITLSGACYPYHEEIVLPVTCLKEGKWIPDKKIPVPLMVGSDRDTALRVGFIGDSITQGCGTEMDSYTHWVAKIAEKLPSSVSVWDLGIGFARAYDAATDQGWLRRAKTCDVVHVCFGVNDLLRGRNAEEVIGDLHTIVCALNASGCRVILFTVPPFDMTGDAMRNWYAVNAAIRAGKVAEHCEVFDFAAVLGQKAPYEHLSVYGGHPNAEGCVTAAEAYLRADLLHTAEMTGV